MYLFESGRLRFRELNGNDAQFAFDLNNDPEVIRYTGDPPFESLEAARNFLEEYISVYRQWNRGRWGVELKENGKLIGWCGLKFHEKENITDLGYRFFRSEWGKGYATEASLATIAYGKEQLNLQELYAHARIENTASVRVLQKCGFEITGEDDECGGRIYVFRKSLK